MSESKNRVPFAVHVIIIIALMFGVGFIPPVSQLTVTGMQMLGILLGTIYGVAVVSPAWPCLIAMGAMGIFHVADYGTILSAGIGNDSIIFMTFFFIFVAVLEQNNITEFLASWMITRKAVAGRPWLFSYILIVGTMFAGAIGSSFPAMIIFWGILSSTCKMYDIKPFTKYPTLMFMGIAIGGLASSSTWLFRGNPLFVNALLTQISNGEYSLNFGIYALFSFIMWMLVIAGYILFCKYVFKVDVSVMKNIDAEALGIKVKKLNKAQRICIFFVVVVLVVYCGMGFTPSSSAAGQFFAGLGNTIPLGIILAVMAFVRIDGKPLYDFAEAAKQGVDWNTIVLAGILLGMSTIMMQADTGINETILALLNPVFQGRGTIFMCIVICLISVFLTNFMANTTVGLLFTPVIYSFAMEMGFNPMPLIAMMLISIHIAYVTPAASPFASLLFGNSHWVKSGDIYKYGAITCVLITIVFLVIGIPISNIFF